MSDDSMKYGNNQAQMNGLRQNQAADMAMARAGLLSGVAARALSSTMGASDIVKAAEARFQELENELGHLAKQRINLQERIDAATSERARIVAMLEAACVTAEKAE